MERELWTALCALAERLHNRFAAARYSDEAICAVYWWAVVHDRPTSWACRRENWPAELIRRVLPSQPTMSRRLRSAAVEQLLLDVEQALWAFYTTLPLVLAIDGKTLPVGRPSKDVDAACCRGAKGYKLHAVWGQAPPPHGLGAGPAEHQRATHRADPLGRSARKRLPPGRQPLRRQLSLRRGGPQRLSAVGRPAAARSCSGASPPQPPPTSRPGVIEHRRR